MNKKSTIKRSMRRSAWQLRAAAARKNLAWAWERMTWMALGAVLMWITLMIWR